MKVWQILRTLEKLESSMSNYYDRLARCHRQDQEAAAFFARMREEEVTHRDIVRFERRLTLNAPEAFEDLKDYDQAELEQTVRTIEDLAERAPELTLGEALHSSVQIERSATQQHYRSIVGKVSPGLRSLIRSLGGSDSEHAARLEAFALGRGVALHL